jgi:YHS domain-containing protein
MNKIPGLAILCLSFAFAACTAEASKDTPAATGANAQSASPAASAPAASAPAAAAPAAAAPAAGPALAPELLAKLEKADAKDGAVDHVVHKCAGCSLGMDGKDKFPMQLAGYTMHFCKQACLDRYQKDPQKALLTLKVKD